ncbi:MAG: LppX_LprAFG lipoprotein, partial [Marmoricola sp.]
MTSRSRIVARSLALALAVGVSFGLAGCGNENTGKGLASADGADITYAREALPKDDIMRATYEAAMKAKSAHMTMTMSGKAKLSAKGDIVYGARQPAMSMTMSMPQMAKGRLEMRLVGGVIYMQLPGLTPPGKFVAIDPKDKASMLAKSFAGTADQMDPLKSLRTAEKAVQSADRVGKQTLGGVEVDHYKVVVDTAALVKGLDPAAAKQAQIPETVTYDMWLDAENLLRRMSFAMSGVEFEAEMSRWGKPVTVQSPAPGDIVTMPTPQA